MTLSRFRDKVVLITGGASGIGRAAALRVASESGAVIIADRNGDGAREVAALARAAGATSADARVYDAANAESCRRMVDDAASIHGRLDCLFNNAGIYRRGHFLESRPGEWDQILAINLTSFYHVIQQALPHLFLTRGNVVSTASTAGLDGIAYAAPYAAAKAGVIALTKSLAVEFAPRGIRFNAICPGRVKTEIGTGLPPIRDPDESLIVRPPRLAGKEAGDPEDIASAFAFLASSDGAFASGAVLVVDGAQTVG